MNSWLFSQSVYVWRGQVFPPERHVLLYRQRARYVPRRGVGLGHPRRAVERAEQQRAVEAAEDPAQRFAHRDALPKGAVYPHPSSYATNTNNSKFIRR